MSRGFRAFAFLSARRTGKCAHIATQMALFAFLSAHGRRFGAHLRTQTPVAFVYTRLRRPPRLSLSAEAARAGRALNRIGPPGYVGYDEGGQLTEAVRRKPYSVVLFDEVEKAHPDVFNVLLQVLDDGRITDSQGRTVDFKNTIIIMTSNIGSTYLLDGIDENGGIKPDAENLVMQDLRAHFRPEFLNRLDEIIMFKPLTKANIGNIVDLLIADVNKRLADKELKVELTPEAKEFVVSHGFDPTYGARPLKRYIQKTVETLAAKLILAGNISTGTILIDVDGDKLEARSKGEVQK